MSNYESPNSEKAKQRTEDFKIDKIVQEWKEILK
jgi:hypothetical protein